MASRKYTFYIAILLGRCIVFYFQLPIIRLFSEYTSLSLFICVCRVL